MKIINKIYSLLAAVMILIMASCSPDEFGLGDKNLSSEDLAENIAFTITHDESNPNIVKFKSLLPSSYSVVFDTPQGRFQQDEVSLKIPFNGTYQARVGVETRGGFLWGPYAEFKVDDFCAEFVTDPLWTYLSGGVGKSKRWKLDIDANTITKHSDLWAGPLGFWGMDDDWSTCMMGQTASAGDHWNWTPDIASNSWVMSAIDYGYMEFDLIGGAHVTVYNAETGETFKGTYMLDTDNHTITFSDAELLHNSGHDKVATNWRSGLKLMGLADDRLQIAAVRDNSDEGKCLLCYNFVSEEYWNNWTPSAAENTHVKPTLMTDWRDWVEQKTNKEITYKLANPDNEEGKQFDYCNLDGSAKGIQLTAASGIEDATLVMNSESKSYIYTAPDGSQVSGKYTLTDEGVFTFDKGFGNTQLSATGNYNMHANADNTLRILKVSKDDYTGHLKDLWLGSQCLDDQGNLYQYQAYHWVAQNASSASGPKYKANLFFNNSGWGWTHDGGTANYMSTNVFITGDGDYSLKFEGAESNPYLLYIDVNKILKDNPNCDITIKSIKVDGKSVDFDDTLISRGYTDDDPSTNSFRRYVLNPWGPAACFKFDSGNNEFTDFKCSSSIEVVITVKMDTGAPVVKPSEDK